MLMVLRLPGGPSPRFDNTTSVRKTPRIWSFSFKHKIVEYGEMEVATMYGFVFRLFQGCQRSLMDRRHVAIMDFVDLTPMKTWRGIEVTRAPPEMIWRLQRSVLMEIKFK